VAEADFDSGEQVEKRQLSQPTTPNAPPSSRAAADNAGSTTQKPSLHIDIQVHISADASPEQIDQIFSSMAKHLYNQN
jgi:hypothetical protein